MPVPTLRESHYHFVEAAGETISARNAEDAKEKKRTKSTEYGPKGRKEITGKVNSKAKEPIKKAATAVVSCKNNSSETRICAGGQNTEAGTSPALLEVAAVALKVEEEKVWGR